MFEVCWRMVSSLSVMMSGRSCSGQGGRSVGRAWEVKGVVRRKKISVKRQAWSAKSVIILFGLLRGGICLRGLSTT